MKSSFILHLGGYLFKPPEYLWSRGWYGIADQAGDGSLFYRAQRTEKRVKTLKKLVGRDGLIWVRMGSSPWHKGKASDVILFANEVVGRLGGKTVLVTTDGDMSIPGDLPEDVTRRIVDDKNIVAWFTQNYDGSADVGGKLRPIPIGLDLHTGPNSSAIRPTLKARWFKHALNNVLPTTDRIPRVWSDVHFKNNPGRHGDPRSELRDGIGSSRLDNYVDTPQKRLSYEEVWSRYGSYRFVVSLPGAGLDTHRTWEALALGATVITVHTPLDSLLEPYRVVFLDATKTNWWKVLGDQSWLSEAAEKGLQGNNLDLTWPYWDKLVRDLISS